MANRYELVLCGEAPDEEPQIQVRRFVTRSDGRETMKACSLPEDFDLTRAIDLSGTLKDFWSDVITAIEQGE